MMAIYAPKDDGQNPMLKGNDPDAYAASIASEINRASAAAATPQAPAAARVTAATRVSDLTPDQLQVFAQAIQRVETGPNGAGTIIPYGDAAMPKEIAIRLERATYANPP
jgi:hypothetical protein